MSTLYDLFKVSENASQEEIKASYDNILAKANSLPQNDKLIEQIRRIKIAYGILSDPEKRKKYDSDLATKRADELLENVQVREPKNETIEKEMVEENSVVQENPIHNVEKAKMPINEERIKQEIDKQIQNIAQSQVLKDAINNQNEQLNQQRVLEKQIKKQERKKKRQAQKEKMLQREMQIQAYGEYLEKQGYKVKYPWTWLRIKRLMISIMAVVIAAFILWHIPPVKKMLMDLYQDNFVIKYLVDIIISIFTWIIESIKNIFR